MIIDERLAFNAKLRRHSEVLHKYKSNLHYMTSSQRSHTQQVLNGNTQHKATTMDGIAVCN